MKTKELLDKYQKIISSVLNCKSEEIKFTVANIEIAEIEYFEPEKDENMEETGIQIRHTFWKNWSEGSYKVFQNDKLISSFELYKLPHCCAILVSCKSFVKEEFRGKRIGTIMNSFRQDVGRVLGYSSLMCTDIEQNKHQRQLLKTNGWTDIHSVINKRTKNHVYLSIINL